MKPSGILNFENVPADDGELITDNISVTGSIIVDDGTLVITGDGTITVGA